LDRRRRCEALKEQAATMEARLKPEAAPPIMGTTPAIDPVIPEGVTLNAQPLTYNPKVSS
jgi:hypothetical protein